MADARSPSLLARWTRGRKSATPRPPEPADMGTAYGMEFTLEQRLLPGKGPAVGASADLKWLGRWLAGRSGT